VSVRPSWIQFPGEYPCRSDEYVGDLAADVPTDDTNLIWRSFATFCERFDTPVPDIAIVATTAIPLERGMGSSSAAIVAGLALARAVTGVGQGDRELVELASELEGHPDNVAPAVLGGLTACTTDDAGRVVTRRLTPAPKLRPVMLVPANRQATAAARGVLPEQLSREDAVVQAGRAGHVLGALGGWWPMDVGAAGDLLHEPARREAMPVTAAVLDDLRGAGLHAWLSGAGPSVAAAVDALDPRIDGIIDDIARRYDFEVLELRFDLSGVVACPDDGCAFSGRPECLQCPRRRL
jgi:homoserine kinase